MLLSDLNSDFQIAVRKELNPGEQVLWYGQPDPDTIATSLLPDSVILLSGLFLMFASVLLNSPGDTSNLRAGLIFLLIVVAVVRLLELIFVPRRAARTVYVVTNKRVLSLCVTKKLSAEQSDPEEKQILREDNNSPQVFYMANLPGQMLMFLIALDVVRALAHKFDPFLAAGFGLVIVGWLRPWIYEMRVPLAKFREAPRALYAIEDMFVATQSLPRDRVSKVKMRRFGKDIFNIFVLSSDSGCMRLRAVSGAEKAQALVGSLLGPGASEQLPG